jgi:hypothetical protein
MIGPSIKVLCTVEDLSEGILARISAGDASRSGNKITGLVQKAN